MAVDERQYVWQPLMVIAPERIECHCGNKAIFVILRHRIIPGATVQPDYSFSAWCRDCWEKEQA